MAQASMALDAYLASVGQSFGPSPWLTIEQERIDQFADATLDRQFIHVDPIKAAKTPFGGTIAHGFLTLSLLSWMIEGSLPKVEGTRMAVNYGFDQIRFRSPVACNSAIRGRFTLTTAERRKDGGILSSFDVAIEIKGEDRPALTAVWLGLIYVDY